MKKNLLLTCFLLIIIGCLGKEKDFNEYTPVETINLYYISLNKKYLDILNKIVYQDVNETDQEFNNKIKKNFYEPIVPLKIKLAYMKGNTAKVSLWVKAWWQFNGVPSNEIILRKQNGIWKYDDYLSKIINEEGEKYYKENNDPAYFYIVAFNKCFQDKEYALGVEMFNKYLIMEPRGFWSEKAKSYIGTCKMYLSPSELERLYGNNKIELDEDYYYAKGIRQWKYEGNYDEAIKYFKQAIEKSNFMTRPKIRAAIESVEGLIKEDAKNDPQHFEYQGEYYQERGNYMKAMEYYHKSLKVDSNSRWASDARKGIEECEKLLKEKEESPAK